MKIEMGESLCASWLKHVKKCQIVQTNWRPLEFWDESRFGKVADALKSINQLLKGLNNVFPKKGNEIDVEQIMTMTEVDIVGIKFDSNGQIECVYGVESAFHSDGLHYKRTVNKVVAKLVKDVLSLWLFLGAKKVEVSFVSPVVKQTPLKAIQEVLPIVNDCFTRNIGELCDCKIRFLTQSKLSQTEESARKKNVLQNGNGELGSIYEEIVKPLIVQLPLIDDDTELFMRSVLLGELCLGKHLPVRSSLRSALRSMKVSGDALLLLDKQCLDKLSKPGNKTAVTAFLSWREKMEKIWNDERGFTESVRRVPETEEVKNKQ